MAPPRLYVDANIFIRLLEGNDELASAIGTLFSQAWNRRIALVTSELTLAEVLVIPIRAGLDRSVARYDSLIRSNAALETNAIDRATLHSAAALRASYRALKLPDAIHLATALWSGCDRFLTADMKLDGNYTEAGRSVAMVRPDDASIRALAAGEGA
jgi:predicted nucleic acid-binding protein